MRYQWQAYLALVLLSLFCSEAKAQAPGFLPGCVYNATPPTLADKQTTSWQCDINGKLITSSTGLAVGTASITGVCTSGFLLYNNAGVLGCVAPGSGFTVGAAIAGGADKRVLFDDMATIGENAAFTFTKATGVLGSTIFDAATGFRVAAGAASGNVLRGNGTNFVSAQLACADLSVACITGNQTITLSGDVTGSGTTAITTTLANIPTATPMAGSLLATEIAAPGTPAAGKISLWTDSTDARFHDINPAGTIGTTVVKDTGTANNFLTAISAAGVISKARPTCANLSDSGTACTSAAGITQLTGDVTAGPGSGSQAATLANIPTGTPAVGTILYTNIAAPSSPAAGKVAVYSDSTDLRFHDKNASGTIGTTVVADTGTSNNFLTAISAAGVISKAQPAFSNLSGSNTVAQLGVSAASHAALIDIAGTSTWKVIPDCTDASGNHLNYTQSTDVFSCGTTGSGVTSLTPGNGVTSTITAAPPGSAITTTGTLSTDKIVNAQSGTSYTIVDGDRAKLITATNAAAQAYSIAQAGAASAFQSGWYVDIQNNSTNVNGIVTITPATSTINGAATLKVQPGQYVRVASDGTNYQIFALAGVAQIPGTTTNDTANAGNLGQFLESNIVDGSAVSVTSAVATDITSLSLTAGDWNVEGIVCTVPAGSTTTQTILGWISSTSATQPTRPNSGAYVLTRNSISAGNNECHPTGGKRFSLSSTTTVYLSTVIVFLVSTMQAGGYIKATRMR